MAAGSLLGVRLGKKRRGAAGAGADAARSYPVGQVELLDVEPLDFSEFLRARDPALHGFYKSYVRDRRPAYAVRFSRMNLRKDGGFVNIPLYLAPRFERCLAASPK